jgi:hypothetical protein
LVLDSIPFPMQTPALGVTRLRGSATGAGEDHEIDHNKNWLRFPYVFIFDRSHDLSPPAPAPVHTGDPGEHARLDGIERELKVSPFLACIGSPCLRHCVHGDSIGAGGDEPGRGGGRAPAPAGGGRGAAVPRRGGADAAEVGGHPAAACHAAAVVAGGGREPPAGEAAGAAVWGGVRRRR